MSTVAYEMIITSNGHGEIFQVFSAGSSSLKKNPRDSLLHLCLIPLQTNFPFVF